MNAHKAPKAPKPPIPRWAWIFAAACFVIPVFTIGGAIPTAIGAFSGLGILGISRKPGFNTRKKVILCSLVTGSAWTVFLVFLFSLAALQAKHPQLEQPLNKVLKAKRTSKEQAVSPPARAEFSSMRTEAPPQDEESKIEKEKKIYSMAIRMRYHIDVAVEQRAKMKAKGFDVSSRDKMIERLEQREQDHFEFVMNFHKIDRNELDRIVAAGDRNHWPTR